MFPLASRLLHDLFDVGLELRQSVRTPAQSWKFAAAGSHHLHVAHRVPLSGRQREAVRHVLRKVPAPPRARYKSLFQYDLRGAQERAAAIRRDRLPARAEHQTLARRTARPATGALAGLRPLRRGRSRGLATGGRSSPRPTRTICARPASFCCGCATSCTFTPANPTTCSTSPNKCAWPNSTNTRAPKEFCRSNNS